MLYKFYQEYKYKNPYYVTTNRLLTRMGLMYIVVMTFIYILFYKDIAIYYTMFFATIIFLLSYVLLITMKEEKTRTIKEKSFLINLLQQYNYYNIESIDTIIQYCQTKLYKKENIKKYIDVILTVLLTVLGTLTLDVNSFSIEIRLTVYLFIILCIGIGYYTIVNIVKSIYHKTFFSDTDVAEDLLLNLLDIKLSIIQKPKSESKGIIRKLLKMIKKR